MTLNQPYLSKLSESVSQAILNMYDIIDLKVAKKEAGRLFFCQLFYFTEKVMQDHKCNMFNLI